MNEMEIIGLVVIGLSALFGVFGALVKLIIAPINELSINVSKLSSTLDNLGSDNSRIEKRVDNHSTRLDKIDLKLARHQIS